MKLIIEIDESIYQGIINGKKADKSVEPREIVRSFQATIADAIANGIPYNPSGDLISREALKEEVRKHAEYYADRTSEDRYNVGYTECACEILDFIDNAPPVPLPNEQVISDIPKDYLYDTETEEFYVYRNKYTGKEIHIVKNPPAYILDKRLQGEWIVVKDEKWGDNVKCPFCGKELAGTDLNFCCKCGAHLKGGRK